MPERQDEIVGISNLVEKCHIVRNDILSGRMSINLCEFINRELQKLTFENIHKCSKIQYCSQLNCLIESFNNQLMQFQKLLQIVKQNQTLYFKRNKKSEKITMEYMRHQISITEQEIICLNQTAKDESHLPVIQTEEIQIEMSDNKEIPKNTLRIKFKRILMGPTTKFYLKFLFRDEQYTTNSTNSAGIFNYQQDIDGKILRSQVIEVRLYQACRIFSYKEVLVTTISLNSLDWSNQIDDYLPYPTQDYPECKIEFCLQLREAILKTNNQATLTSKHFLKSYPKLELNRGQLEYEGTHLPKAIQLFELKIAHFKQSIEQSVFQQNVQILESIVEAKRQDQSPKEIILPQAKQIESIPEDKDEIQIIIHGTDDDEIIRQNQDKIPNGLTLEDVLQPENPKKSPVSGFIVEYKKLIEKQMMTLRGPQRRVAQNILEDFMRQEIVLKKLADNEQFEEYLSLIKDLPQREKKLIDFYSMLKLTRWASVIKFRLEKLNEELLALGVEEEVIKPQQPQQNDEPLTSESIQLIVHGNEDDELIKSKQDQIPEGLSLEDVLQPENPKKSPVSGFIVEYKKIIEKQMMTLRGPQRRMAQNILEDFMRSEIQLGNLAKNGEIEQYLGMIKNLAQREDQLIGFYDLIKLGEWSKVVRYRKQILLEELQSLS